MRRCSAPLSFSLPPSCPPSSLTARPVQASSSRASAHATLIPHFQPTSLWSFNFSLSNKYSFQNVMITDKNTLHNCFWIGTIYTRLVRFELAAGSCSAASDHPGHTLLKPQHHQLVHQQIATAGSSGHIHFVLKEKLRFSLQRCCEPVTLGALHFLSVSTCSRVCKGEVCHVR